MRFKLPPCVLPPQAKRDELRHGFANTGPATCATMAELLAERVGPEALTPLLMACHEGHGEVVKVLMARTSEWKEDVPNEDEVRARLH